MYMYTYRHKDIETASIGELKIMKIDIWRRQFMSNETDNKTPREFFRITSGLLVRYTRSCVTRQKCLSGAHGHGENERGSPWYIAGLEKWFSPAGESGDPEMQFTLWLTTNRLPENRSVTDTRTQTYTCIQTRLAMRSPNGFGLHASSMFASSIFVRLYTRAK